MNTYRRRSPLIVAAALLLAGGLLAVRHPVRAQEPAPVTVSVEANRQQWLDTGIELADGETLTLSAKGSAGWEPGVEGGAEGAAGSTCALSVPSAPVGALLARVGASAPVKAGAQAELRGPGRVFLLYNDCPGQYFDNSGVYRVSLQVRPAPAPAPEVTPEPAPQAAPHPEPAAPAGKDSGGGLPIWPLIVLVVAAAGGAVAYFGRQYLPIGPVNEFNDRVRLESSAWLAPARLRILQGEGLRRRRFLSVGGPDADVDFGLPGVWAKLVPTEDGHARIEPVQGSGRVLVDGVALVVGQRLKNGARVFMGTREFIYRSDAEAGGPITSDEPRRGKDALAKPDPRVAALMRPRTKPSEG